MIFSVKPVLTEDLCVVQKEECTLDEKSSTLIRDKPIFSWERMLQNDYYHKSSAGKESLIVGLKGPGAKMNWLAVNRQS
jgi:hypothetical protein